MKIVVVGGTGLIGAKLVSKLKNHEVIAASPSRGVNALTGEGIKEALKGADVVVDVSNSPSFEDKAALEFFETTTRNLLKAEEEAGVKHHVALSVVGTDRLSDSGYFRAKLSQENLIRSSSIPYTIVRATQFFEFLNSIRESCVIDDIIHVPEAYIQPIAADDVVDALLEVTLAKPANAIIDIAGPKRYRFTEISDSREVIVDPDAGYFGTKLKDDSLIPLGKARLGTTSLEAWKSGHSM